MRLRRFIIAWIAALCLVLPAGLHANPLVPTSQALVEEGVAQVQTIVALARPGETAVQALLRNGELLRGPAIEELFIAARTTPEVLQEYALFRSYPELSTAVRDLATERIETRTTLAARALAQAPSAEQRLGAMACADTMAPALAGVFADLGAAVDWPNRAVNATRGKIADNAFIVNRTLRGNDFSYEAALGPAFIERLNGLRLYDHWIDMGAGDALAIREYLENGGRSVATAVAYVEPTDPAFTAFARSVHANSFRGLFGRYVEDIPTEQLGVATIVSDLMGPLAYSPQMDEIIAKYAETLEVGGEIYTAIPYQTVVKDAEGNEWLLEDFIERWIADSEGLELVEVVPDEPWWGVRMHLRKTSDDVVVPPLTLLHLEPGGPTRRWYLYAAD